MKLLVLGGNGQLGKCLLDQLRNYNGEYLIASRDVIDITNLDETKRKILDYNPDFIINAGAYTLVDKAETEPKKADLVNNIAVLNIAKISKLIDACFIHVSTDYVFDGKLSRYYKEDDKTNPIGAYGKSKLDGENSIQQSGCKFFILRTAWVYSEYGNNFLKTMIKLGEIKNTLSIVDDQYGCPTYAQDIAKAILGIIKAKRSKNFENEIYNFCGSYNCSWYEFAKIIFKNANEYGYKTPRKLIKVNSSDYKTIAERPKNSSLDCKKIKNHFNIFPSNLESGIKSSFLALTKDK